jgi:non-ribosomal peptide synthetase component F
MTCHYLARQTADAEAIEHQDYPFPLLVNRLNPRRDTGRLPICSVVFGLQKPQQFSQATRLFDADAGHADWGGMDVLPYDLAQQEGQFDLTLEMFDANDSFLGTLKYDTDLFRPETAARMAQHYLRLAESIVADPHGRWPNTNCCPKLPGRCNSGTLSTRRACIGSLSAVGLLTGSRRPMIEIVTYDQLNRRANQLARLFVMSLRPGDTVAIPARESRRPSCYWQLSKPV